MATTPHAAGQPIPDSCHATRRDDTDDADVVTRRPSEHDMTSHAMQLAAKLEAGTRAEHADAVAVSPTMRCASVPTPPGGVVPTPHDAEHDRQRQREHAADEHARQKEHEQQQQHHHQQQQEEAEALQRRLDDLSVGVAAMQLGHVHATPDASPSHAYAQAASFHFQPTATASSSPYSSSASTSFPSSPATSVSSLASLSPLQQYQLLHLQMQQQQQQHSSNALPSFTPPMSHASLNALSPHHTVPPSPFHTDVSQSLLRLPHPLPSQQAPKHRHIHVEPHQLKSTRAYVGNLSFTTGSYELSQWFYHRLGCPLRIEIISYPSGRSKGCAILEFERVEDTARAINELSGSEIAGRKIFIREDREDKGFASSDGRRSTQHQPLQQHQHHHPAPNPLLFPQAAQPPAPSAISSQFHSLLAAAQVPPPITFPSLQQQASFLIQALSAQQALTDSNAFASSLHAVQQQLAANHQAQQALTNFQQQHQQITAPVRPQFHSHALATSPQHHHLQLHQHSPASPSFVFPPALTNNALFPTSHSASYLSQQRHSRAHSHAGVRPSSSFTPPIAHHSQASRDGRLPVYSPTMTIRPLTLSPLSSGAAASADRRDLRRSNTQVYFANLPWRLTSSELRDLCSPHGHLLRADITVDALGHSRGFGFGRFATPDQAMSAIASLHDSDIGGRKIIARIDSSG